jgi:hypothetical protein
MSKKQYNGLADDDDDIAPDQEGTKAFGQDKGNEKKKDGKQSNTIIQQINGFSMTPMNDRIAKQTIEDHKYLLEHVENRAGIAYFAVANRNQSLFCALKNYVKELQKEEEEAEAKGEAASEEGKKKGKGRKTKPKNKDDAE